MKHVITTFVGLYAFFAPLSTHAQFTDQADIPDWAESAIVVLGEQEVMKGNDDGNFRPNDEINRAEFCKILITATKTPLLEGQRQTFPDVYTGDWFFDYVETAKAQGWVKGYDDGNFRPGNKINRAEIAKVLAHAFGLKSDEAEFASHWYTPFIETLKEADLLPHNTGLNNFNPSKLATRAEVAEQIHRTMKRQGLLGDSTPASTFEESEPTSQPQNETYVYVPEAVFDTPIKSNPGTLSIAKASGVNKKVYVYRSEEDTQASTLLFTAKNQSVKIEALQFRRIGSGKANDYSQAWIEIDGKLASSKVLVNDDVVQIPLLQAFTIPRGVTKNIVLKVNLSGQGTKGTTSRFVLYLPEWIASDTNKKIGFFPFAGPDLEIKN